MTPGLVRLGVVLALLTLSGSIPLLAPATGLPADGSPSPIAFGIASLPTVTSGRVMATITGMLPDLNATVTNASFIPVSINRSIQSGMTGVNATWTNSMPFSRVANVWFVAYTLDNHVVFTGFAQLPYAANGSNMVFEGLSSALPSGSYTVESFLISTFGTALSPVLRITISF